MVNNLKTCIIIESFDPLVFSTKYVFTEKITNQEIYNNIISKTKYTPSEKDKLFFMSGCTIPRFKVKTFCEHYKTHLVKSINDANVKIISIKAIEEMFNTYYELYRRHQFYNKQRILKYLDLVSNYNTSISSLITSINNSTSEQVLFARTLINKLTDSKLPQIPFKLKELETELHYRYFFHSVGSYAYFINICNSTSVYGQEDILSRINTGGVMTEKQYESVREMLKSSDISNVKIAMEAMANCDYEKSCVLLMLLIKENGKVLYESPTRNHVNFKSLLHFFSIKNLNHLDLNTIITLLLKRGLLNKSNLDILMPLAMTQVKDKANLYHFEVGSLIPNDELNEGIKNNVLDISSDTEIISDTNDQLQPKNLDCF